MNQIERKAFAIVLHSHLPWVLSHGVWPHGAEWLFEAASETYIPLIQVVRKLASEGLPANITVGLTPILVEQLADDEFKSSFVDYLRSKIESAQGDVEHFEREGFHQRAKVARMWVDFFTDKLEFFDSIGRDLVGEFRRLQDEGLIEIITSAATHGYLPLLGRDECVKAQVEIGVAAYEQRFGRRPKGIWPPELAYRPRYRWKPPVGSIPEFERAGVEEFYHDAGIRYFIVDQHLLKGGKPIGTYLSLFEGLKLLWEQFKSEYEFKGRELSPYQPYLAASHGSTKMVAFFTRDPQTALQVWSRDWGYPGDPNYLEFHKRHFPSGHKYWRVTDSKADLADKAEYDPESVNGPLNAQSDHFVQLVNRLAAEHDGIVVAPYDTELFGHWWFEGPRWLYLVLKKLHKSQVKPVKLGDYLDAFPPEDVIALPEGSWGEGGFHWVWLNEWTSWTWEKIYDAEVRTINILKSKGIDRSLLQQILRELLLLESSDWQFLITTWSARDYAEIRFSEHYEAIDRLLKIVENDKLTPEDLTFIEDLAKKDRIFGRLIEPKFWNLD